MALLCPHGHLYLAPQNWGGGAILTPPYEEGWKARAVPNCGTGGDLRLLQKGERTLRPPSQWPVKPR